MHIVVATSITAFELGSDSPLLMKPTPGLDCRVLLHPLTVPAPNWPVEAAALEEGSGTNDDDDDGGSIVGSSSAADVKLVIPSVLKQNSGQNSHRSPPSLHDSKETPRGSKGCDTLLGPSLRFPVPKCSWEVATSQIHSLPQSSTNTQANTRTHSEQDG
jgi:hypothetical protein